jgi:hypothetical protein
MVNLRISDTKRVMMEKYISLVLVIANPNKKAAVAAIKTPRNMLSHTESPTFIANRAEPYAPTSKKPLVPREISPVRLIVRMLEARRTLMNTMHKI